MTRELTLQSPWWIAGSDKYLNWKLGDNVGFGMSKALYNSGDDFIIKTNWGNYKITKEEVKEFAKNH